MDKRILIFGALLASCAPRVTIPPPAPTPVAEHEPLLWPDGTLNCRAVASSAHDIAVARDRGVPKSQVDAIADETVCAGPTSRLARAVCTMALNTADLIYGVQREWSPDTIASLAWDLCRSTQTH
jgi:hypothetical protein